MAEEGDDLIILDQHGAHERILYERLLKNPRVAPVTLPSPVVVRLPEDLAREAWSFEAELNSLGFRFEPFGDGALRVSKVPETVVDAEAALTAALGALAGGEDLAKALACKGSTRFGQSLSHEEMEGLLSEWASTEFKETCAPRWKNCRLTLPRPADRKRSRASRVGEGLKTACALDLTHRVCRIG